MADKEYIERRAVLKDIEDFHHTSHIQSITRETEKEKTLWRGVCSGVNYCRNTVIDAPAADVIEIPESGIGDLSDGYHTFNELYHHRAILFSVICNLFPYKAWKSKLHDTGDMYEGMFIVGIETPMGQATYHYDTEPYWDMFNVKELEKAPKWDGHTPEEAIERIATLSAANVAEVRRGEWVSRPSSFNPCWDDYFCSVCNFKFSVNPRYNFCPNCGAVMRGKEDDRA